MSALEVRGVTVARGARPVVRDVDLRVPAGEVTALMGANGAGKSTLVLAIAGTIPLVSGAIVSNGVEISGKAPHRIRAAGVAVLPEGHRVFGDLTVAENLGVAGTRLPAGDVPGAVDDAFELFPELAELAEQLAGTLSGGQQQMLAIASALVGRPEYLLIDELSLGLAPVIVRRLCPVVRQIADQGVGVLLIEQFATVALGVADTAAVMQRGRIALTGTASEITDQTDLLHGAYLAA